MTEQFREIRFSDEQIAALKQADEYIHKGTVSVDYVDKEAIQKSARQALHVADTLSKYKLDYVWFFLHFYEKKLNGRIEKMISLRTDLCTKVEQYAEIKMQCREYIGNIPAKDVYNAFMKLSYKEQRMIEKRLAICMQCKRVSDPAFRTSFEDMAIDFELKSPRAAEKIYRKALDEITKILIEKSDFDGAEITLESRNGYGIRTKSAVYKFRPYCPENEFEWGTIEFDFTTGKTKVDKPFLFDAYETEVEKYIKSIPVSNLPKEAIVPFV